MIITAFFDGLLIFFSFILAYYFRFKVMLFITPTSVPLLEQYLNILIFILLVWLAIFKLVGLYENKRSGALVDEIALLLGGVTIGSLILVGLLFLYRELWFSRLVIVNAWWIAFLLLSFSRIVLLLAIRLGHSLGIGVKNTLILGAGEIGQALAYKMQKDKALGYHVVGFLADAPIAAGKKYHGLPVLGGLALVKEVIQRDRVAVVIIAGSETSTEKILDIITECERFGVEFRIVPGILELIASRVDIDELAGVPLIAVSEIRLKGLNALVKRVTDIILCLFWLVLFSPLLLAFAVLIKLTSPGPVLFFQERVGMDEKHFLMFKFRSMVKDADKMISELEPFSETEGHLFKMKADPRITPLGRFMRRYSIDELPQLFNVLIGQMSMVGPRPPLPREVVKYNTWQKKRLRVRPGITGPWQVSGRSLLPFEDMVRLDIFYIENWSLWLDLKLLLKTVPVVLLGRGAY
ncbi:MAG: sugar transferase [Candidatus Margulisbacteria bacterium]|nr:sugar transferase [Candidatus Margulisiibacteriota bacterium]